MPYLYVDPPKGADAAAWHGALKKAFTKRVWPDLLTKAFQQLYAQSPARPRDIASTLLRFRYIRGGGDDPLLFRYTELLIREKYFTPSDVLVALLSSSDYSCGGAASTTIGFPTCEERMFALLTQYYMSADLPKSSLDLMALVHIITRWMKVVSEDALAKQLQGIQPLDQSTNGLYDALGTLILAVFGHQGIRVLVTPQWWKQRRAAVVTEIENYDAHVLQWAQSQLAGRVRHLTGSPPFIKIDEKGIPVFTDEQILSQISELHGGRSRAGIFVWLSAALAARPLTDDHTMLSYLQGRYSDDAQSLIVDLLVASFDVLTNALLTKEKAQKRKVIRSFICNKVPVLITMLQNSIHLPLNPETCIQMALIPGGMISMDPLPPITAGANDTRDQLKACRLEFLQACALHGLVTEATISQIVQESVALPRVSKLNRDSLVAQCANNMSRLGELIEDLPGMQGNTGAIAGCILQTVNALCHSKDTMSLKSVCDRLVRRVPYMDFLMQYAQPGVLLLPLCNLLNDWVHDQDQSEFTPAYEEFASILLFTLAVVHRYDLNISDIGILGDSYVAKLLDDMTVSKPPSDLPPEQGSHLSKWIEGIFTVDDHGETSGIPDDVMRQCPPQSFYQLVPTLFEQSVMACKSNVLNINIFKGGLELLLEPFLLPSLVMGLGWLAEHSWEDHNDADILLQVLEKLLRPSSSSQDTQAMHRAVLAIVADSLFNSLEEFSKKQPNRKQVTKLLELLKPYLNEQRAFDCPKVEVDEWMLQGGLTVRVQQSIRELITWAATSSNPPNPPPKYPHRTFATACQMLDNEDLLKTIVQEVAHAGFSNAAIALDVCTSLICAPTSVPMGPQQSTQSKSSTAKLRSCVRLTSSNVQALLRRPVAECETIIRLGRRVEAQLAFAAQMPTIAMPMQMQDQAADQMLQDLMDGTASGANADGTMNQTTEMADLNQQLDLSNVQAQDLAKLAGDSGEMTMEQNNQLFIDLGIDTNGQQNNNQPLLDNQEEDIFAGLDLGMGGDMGDLGDDFNFG